ncbi:MAG: hypothetical protein ACKOEO_07910 [Planctomycetaceae bacterium]
MQFEEPRAFGPEELLLAAKGPQFLFKVLLGPRQVLELEAKTPLQIALFRQQRLTLLFHFLPQPLLLSLDVLTKLLTLSLQLLCLLLKLLHHVLVLLTTLGFTTLQLRGFFSQSLPQQFSQTALFLAKLSLSPRDALSMFAAVALVLLPEPFAFGVQSGTVLPQLLALLVQLGTHRLFQDDAFLRQQTLGGADFHLLPLNKLLLLTQAAGPQFKFCRELTMFAAHPCDFGGKLTSSLLESRPISVQLLLFGSKFGATLGKFGETLLQCFSGSGSLQQHSEGVRFKRLCGRDRRNRKRRSQGNGRGATRGLRSSLAVGLSGLL